jgi:hypothetical protein
MTNLKKAISYDPTLIESNYKKILSRFVNWIHYFDLDNGGALIKKILNNLPDECEPLRENKNVVRQLKIMLFLKRIKLNIKYARFLKSVIINF